MIDNLRSLTAASWRAVVPCIGVAVVILMMGRAEVVAEAEFRLSLPVACEIGTVCTIQNYVDRDPGPGARDYTCGRLVYDGHKGTDFRLPDASWLHRNIAVLAAAPGTVAGIRNDLPDHLPGQYDPDRTKGRECGNGVLIDHGGGWHTQYCHMRQGSVQVHKGDQVYRQQPLGSIGLSGKTEFPHLHFGVRYLDEVVDPFLGAGAEEGCGVNGEPLWEPNLLADLSYRASGILSSGFTDQVPTKNEVVSGQHRHKRLGRNAPNLVFWVMVFGVHTGDEEELQIITPDGRVLVRKQEKSAKKHKIRWFTYSGKRARGPWMTGTYKGKFQLVRTTGSGRKVVLKSTTMVSIE